MSCECNPYTISKICENSGNSRLIEFVYKNPDGTPINLVGATIVWSLESQITGGVITSIPVTDITQNTCRVSVKLPNVNGNFVQRINVTLQNGETMSDKGIMIIYD